MHVRGEIAVTSAEIGFEIPKIGIQISFETNAGLIRIPGGRNGISQRVGLCMSDPRKNHEHRNDNIREANVKWYSSSDLFARTRNFEYRQIETRCKECNCQEAVGAGFDAKKNRRWFHQKRISRTVCSGS